MRTNRTGLLTSAAVCLACPGMSHAFGVETGAENPSTTAVAAPENNQQEASPEVVGDSGDRRRRQARNIEEVVVTAQKRQERLQDVPISISVLDGSLLDKSSVEGVTDALSRVPGVTAFPTQQGGGTLVSVRGVAASGPVFAGASPIAYYLDSVPFGLVRTAIAPDANAYDLERVEVLRGPQGTLYGANAQNGVVRVLTTDPDVTGFDLKARASAASTELGTPSYRSDVAANVPLIDKKVAARMVLGYQDLGGWIDTPIKRDANDAQIRNARLKLKAEPTDRLSIGVSGWLSRSDTGGVAAETRDGRNDRAFLEQFINNDYDVYALKISYEFTGFSATSSTSYLNYSSDSVLDLSGSGAQPLPLTTDFDADVLSEEVILTSKSDGDWKWSIGGMYRDAEDRLLQTIVPSGFVLQSIDTSKSSAIFGEFGRRFADNHMEWTLGARYFRDEVESREGDASNFGVPGYRARDTFDSTTPRVVLTWFPTESLTMYGSYSEGFRSGAPQAYYVTGGVTGFPSVKPDKLHNYEVGAKGNVWGHRISFDTSLYYIKWDDVQQQLLVPSAGGAPVTALVNADSASGPGVDLGLRAELIDGLEIGLSLSWNDLTFDSDVVSGGLVLFPKGARGNFSPEYTAGATFDYSFPLGSSGFEGKLAASANYTSEQSFTMASNGQVATGAGQPNLFARTSFSIAAREHWNMTIFADNVTNERNAIYAGPGIPPPPDAYVRMRPRTLGVQLDYQF